MKVNLTNEQANLLDKICILEKIDWFYVTDNNRIIDMEKQTTDEKKLLKQLLEGINIDFLSTKLNEEEMILLKNIYSSMLNK